MKKKKYYETTDHLNDNLTQNFDDDFGDDFEVRYTEEIPEISLDPDEENDEYDVEYDNEPDRAYREYAAETSARGYRNTSRRRTYPNADDSAELAAPIRNIVHTGSSLAETLTKLIFRPAPVLMSAIILLITASTYWSDSAKYGNILTVIENPEPSLVTFLAVGAVVLLWELCCFFFTVSGVWGRSGRGLSFFILVYVLSYVSGLAGEMIPEGIAVIDGIRGGLITYGSLYSMIFPFCVIGIITCILQKILGR